jgi:hypothetical protein
MQKTKFQASTHMKFIYDVGFPTLFQYFLSGISADTNCSGIENHTLLCQLCHKVTGFPVMLGLQYMY